MYESIPAGNFRGVGAVRLVRSQPPSRVAGNVPSDAARMALHQAGRRVGIAGLNGADLCNDPGWRFAQGLISGAGSAISQYGAQSHDAGFATAGGATGAVGQAWANACATGQASGAQPTESVADVYARAQAQQAQQAQAQQQQQFQLQMQQQAAAQRAQQEQSSQQNMYLLVGVAAVAGLGVVYALTR